ncbi:MAG: hypothetical protein AAFP02_08480 [Bacteroidota bacterium]
MNKTVHAIYIGTFVVITVLVTVYLFYTGYSYYALPFEERFYHPRHDWFKPSGVFGHGLGIVGTLLILFGVSIYIARKRYNFLGRFIRLKYLLEFHIFLCTLGPIMILFHTAFKFGGIVSVAFWSMVAVVASGVVGRFIYIQIPHSIEGRILSLSEVNDLKKDVGQVLQEKFGLESAFSTQLAGMVADPAKGQLKQLKQALRTHQIPAKDRSSILSLFKEEISLGRKIARLEQMQKLFRYWHVAHMPFALLMLVIVVIHVIVTLAFGYKWIF